MKPTGAVQRNINTPKANQTQTEKIFTRVTPIK
jgi:hypothetical protein